ncbi:MAG: F0F1 ATP synthase subunit B [Peptococcaceae bacterium]|jgi:F-type H+-transporting ATPase subunit b|nr:F0F1 ATP synthase subunit B [Peptococcaceae bacterium]MDR2736998.1 F0F1 ATP synthase subunit B [Gracilibacteraceae bacterium]
MLLYTVGLLLAAEVEHDTVLSPLDFGWTMFLMILSFLIVVWILAKFAWKPLMGMMEKRRQNIEDMLTQAENDRQEGERLRLQYQDELRQAHQDAQVLIEKATKAAELRTAEIMEQAREDAEKTKQAALAQIETERARAVAEIQTQVADISVAVAEKILRKNLDASAQKDMIDQFIYEVGDRPC